MVALQLFTATGVNRCRAKTITTPPVPPEPDKPTKEFPTRAFILGSILSTVMCAGFQAVFGTGGFSDVNDSLAHVVERFVFSCVLFGPMIAGLLLVACVLYTVQK